MKKEAKFNEQAAMNNNLDSATLQMNADIAKQHETPKQYLKQNDKNKYTKI